MAAGDIVVLVPDSFGSLAVCDPQQLVDRLDNGEELYNAIGNSAIDTISPDDVEAVRKVQAANETGDFDTYWGLTE